MNPAQRIATLCALALAFGCGGRTEFQQTIAQAGSRAAGGDAGSGAVGGSGGAQQTGGFSGTHERGGSAGAQPTSGSAGTQSTSVGAHGLWLPRDGFDEVSLDAFGAIRSFAVDASGNIYWASDSVVMDETLSFALTRLSADGQITWTQRVSGQSISLGVDDAGTVYQLRKVNQVAVVDKRSTEGTWLWSREVSGAGPDSSSLRLGRDGALYLATAWGGEHLWKFDSSGSLLWTWDGPGSRGVASFAADANGTVYVRTRITPEAALPSGSKGQESPTDGLLWTLDKSGKALLQRHFVTGFEGTAGAVIYLETGPVNFGVTSGGLLLSVAIKSTGLFDPAGDAFWTHGAADLQPAVRAYGLISVLATGRCGSCVASYSALYAFDAAGKQTETLLLNDDNALAQSWAADQRDNIYALVIRKDDSQSSTVRRYHGASGWVR
jgi:hypothetical protein